MNRKRGFTLLELLIVIAMLAILAVVIILIINPAETLRRGRDSQRLSDLSTLKSALALYLLRAPNPDLDGVGDPTGTCGSTIWIARGNGSAITDGSVFGRTPDSSGGGTSAAIDGNGWIPVDFTEIPEGSPLAALPMDPNYSVADVSSVSSSDFFYAYSCNADNTFELTANMESASFDEGGSNDKTSTDGGNHTGILEVGTQLTLLAGQGIIITINTDFDGHVDSTPVCNNTAGALELEQSSARRPYIRFLLTDLPSGATVTDVDFEVEMDTPNGGIQSDVQAYNLDGQADPQADVTSDCATARTRTANDTTPYLDEDGFAGSSGTKTLQLPAAANTDVQNAKAAVNRFSIGINEGATVQNFGTATSVRAIEHAGTVEPRLIITYTE